MITEMKAMEPAESFKADTFQTPAPDKYRREEIEAATSKLNQAYAL